MRFERFIKNFAKNYLKHREFIDYHKRKTEMGKVIFEVKTVEYSGLVMHFSFRPIFIAQPQTRNQERKFNEKLNEPYFKSDWVPNLIKSIVFVFTSWLVIGRLRNLIVHSSLLYSPDPEFEFEVLSYIFEISNTPFITDELISPQLNYFLTKASLHFNFFDLSNV